MNGELGTEEIVYEVVVNHEDQYSIWPEYKGDPPPGWHRAGERGTRTSCLEWISKVWTDLRPRSLKEAMQRVAESPVVQDSEVLAAQSGVGNEVRDPRDDLVGFLCEGWHPLVLVSNGDDRAQALREAVNRGRFHVRFTDTRGGTQLGLRLIAEDCDLSEPGLSDGTGPVRLVGQLVLDGTDVRCLAEISFDTLEGRGRLERVLD